MLLTHQSHMTTTIEYHVYTAYFGRHERHIRTLRHHQYHIHNYHAVYWVLFTYVKCSLFLLHICTVYILQQQILNLHNYLTNDLILLV